MLELSLFLMTSPMAVSGDANKTTHKAVAQAPSTKETFVGSTAKVSADHNVTNAPLPNVSKFLKVTSCFSSLMRGVKLATAHMLRTTAGTLLAAMKGFLIANPYIAQLMVLISCIPTGIGLSAPMFLALSASMTPGRNEKYSALERNVPKVGMYFVSMSSSKVGAATTGAALLAHANIGTAVLTAISPAESPSAGSTFFIAGIRFFNASGMRSFKFAGMSGNLNFFDPRFVA
mmetsp:Transcript_6125/g.11530  ORF Transcript_6125/g.11530 Transcript_6125/m.11530 type:complete len:232 (-) Transcript_6125:319-1014(-)